MTTAREDRADVRAAREDRRAETDNIRDDGLVSEIASIKADVRWLKWGFFALFAATLAPKLGGPDAASVASALVESVAQAHGLH